MKEFKKGDRVSHPLHGCGTVVEVRPLEANSGAPGLCAVVVFDNKVRQTFALEYAPLKLLTPDELAKERSAVEEWRRLQNETFIKEAAGAEHALGSHWPPFMSDAVEIIKRLPEITRKSMLMTWFAEGDAHAPPYPAPEDWPKAFYLAWPQRERGLLVTLEPTSKANQLISLSPYVGLVLQPHFTSVNVQ